MTRKAILITLIASTIPLTGCGQDMDLIKSQCANIVGEKVYYSGKVVKNVSELSDGIVSVTYGYKTTTYKESSVFCGMINDTVAYNKNIIELKSTLGI